MATRALATVCALAIACTEPGAPHQQVSYPGGGPHWDYELSGDIPNGSARVWHPNGQLRSEGTYVDGAKQGVFRFFDDTGAFEHQAAFVDHIEVWRSDNPNATPPEDIARTLPSPEHTVADEQSEVPDPYFAALDHAATSSRIGVAGGDGDLRHLDAFATYAFSRYGVYGQLLETDVNSPTMPTTTLSGKRTLELGATRRDAIPNVGTLVLRAGVLAPIGNDDEAGYLASAAGAVIDPTDVAASFPSSAALRTSASVTRAQRFFAFQGDVGIDWILAGQTRLVDPVVRANLGVGVGVEGAMVGVEASNAVLAADPTRHLTSLAMQGTAWYGGLWLTAMLAHATSGMTEVSLGVGHVM